MPPRKKSPATSRIADPYQHTIETPMRPEVGMQAQFRKKKAPKKYRYDDSLDPSLSWDGQNSARELGEWLLAKITEASKLPSPHLFSQPGQFIGAGGDSLLTVRGLEDAVAQLNRLSKPFLDWSGKAERLSMDVPTLPLFVHERLSTKAILETLKGHVREGVDEQIGLFGDKRLPLGQKLRPYEHAETWENRMILGDSLVVMNSLLEYEGMAGKVQMIYMDPPYGVRFGSNFGIYIHNSPNDGKIFAMFKLERPDREPRPEPRPTHDNAPTVPFREERPDRGFGDNDPGPPSAPNSDPFRKGG